MLSQLNNACLKRYLFQVCNFSSYHKKTSLLRNTEHFQGVWKILPNWESLFQVFLPHKQIRNEYHFCAICKARYLGEFAFNMNVGLNFPFKKKKSLIINGSWFQLSWLNFKYTVGNSYQNLILKLNASLCFITVY